MKTAIRFSLSTIITLTVLFGLGFYLNPSIVNQFSIWNIILATLFMFSTQPKMSAADFKNPNDKFSMLGISIMAIIVTNITVIEWAYNFDKDHKFNSANFLGFIMIWGGLAFRVYAIQKLSKYFSNASTIQAEHQLFDKGIYSIIRHPSYLGAICTIVGTIIWLETWKTLPISLILIALAYYYRISQEEKILLNYFGDKYEMYCESTGSLFPKLKTKSLSISKSNT